MRGRVCHCRRPFTVEITYGREYSNTFDSTHMPTSCDTFSHFKILLPIGKGGMGEVYLAEDMLLDRKVALKFLSESTERDPMAGKRLQNEAKSAAGLDHPFVCKIYETGEFDGKAFIAMEYVAG